MRARIGMQQTFTTDMQRGGMVPLLTMAMAMVSTLTHNNVNWRSIRQLRNVDYSAVSVMRARIGMQQTFTTDMQRTTARIVRRTLAVRPPKKK